MRMITECLKSMMMVCVMLLGVVTSTVYANEMPSRIEKGLAAYAEKGPKKAVEAWIKGSPLKANDKIMGQADILEQVEDIYGKYVGYEAIDHVIITPTSRIDYVQINYKKGPVFTYFQSYKSGDKWVIINFRFNTKPEPILPVEILFKN